MWFKAGQHGGAVVSAVALQQEGAEFVWSLHDLPCLVGSLRVFQLPRTVQRHADVSANGLLSLWQPVQSESCRHLRHWIEKVEEDGYFKAALFFWEMEIPKNVFLSLFLFSTLFFEII